MSATETALCSGGVDIDVAGAIVTIDCPCDCHGDRGSPGKPVTTPDETEAALAEILAELERRMPEWYRAHHRDALEVAAGVEPPRVTRKKTW